MSLFWDSLEHHIGADRMSRFWMSHPAVRAAINSAIGGSPGRWPLDWLTDQLRGFIPLDNGLVLGCGTGALERDLARRALCRRVTGVDLVEAPLEYAREQAEREHLSDRVTYLRADATAFVRAAATPYSAVFFHASLHHFEDPDEILSLVASRLGPGGWLYLDEYVGPSMSQWSPLRLLVPNLVYYLLPPSVRRPHLIRTPLNPDDPTEAVASAEIVPALRRHFEIRAQRDYGGNLVSLIFPNLAQPGEIDGRPSAAQFERAVRRLLVLERVWMRATRAASFHTVALARPRARAG